MFLCNLFNEIFLGQYYLSDWSVSRLVTVLKSRCHDSCDNNRGITIPDTVAKIYHAILCKRPEAWFKPDR